MQVRTSLVKKKYCLNCLIVAVDSAFANDTKIKVERLGLKVMTIARTFEEIEEALDMYSIDLIFSDEKLNGTNLVDKFYTNRGNLSPLILFSELDSTDVPESRITSDSVVLLCKPFDVTELMIAVADALKGRIKALKQSGDIRRENDTLYVRSSGKLISIDTREIKYIKAEGNYCTLYVDSKRIVVRSSISNVLKRIDKPSFMQIHRGFIVNVRPTSVLSIKKGNLQLGNKELPIGRKYRSNLLRVMKNG